MIISYANGLNYLLMKVFSVVFDLMEADMINFFQHLSVVGSEGMWLDWIGNFYGLKRLNTESDAQYKKRILITLAQPRENNVAIESLVSQTFGVPNVLVANHRLFWCLLYVFGTLDTPRLVMPYTKSVAPAGIKWTGINIPIGGSISGSIAGQLRAGTRGTQYVVGSYSPAQPRFGISRYGPIYTRAGPHINFQDRWFDRVALPLGGKFQILRG